MTLSDLLYGLTFLPLLLIVLTIHEAGHYIAARLYKLRIASFQIGLGPTLFRWYRGTTQVEWTKEVEDLRRQPAEVENNHILRLAISTPSHGTETGPRLVAMLPTNKKDNPTSEKQLEELKRHNTESLQITGRVIEQTETTLSLAPTAFSLRPIPIAAGVSLPEDPKAAARGVYNTAPWRQRITLIIAGPAANIALFAGALLMMSVLPTSTAPPLLRILEVEKGSLAEQAGLQEADIILQINETLAPDAARLSQTLKQGQATKRATQLELSRNGQSVSLEVPPDLAPAPGDRWGLRLETTAMTKEQGLPSPNEAKNRFVHLNQVYLEAFTGLIKEGRATDSVSGPIMAIYQTTKAIELAGIQAWLAVLALISLSAAIVNLLPIPPLDGYQATIQTLKSLRKGKELSPKLEGALAFYGIGFLVLLTLALTARDVYQLTS